MQIEQHHATQQNKLHDCDALEELTYLSRGLGVGQRVNLGLHTRIEQKEIEHNVCGWWGVLRAL